MALLTKAFLKEAAKSAGAAKTASVVLEQFKKAEAPDRVFDVFFSHSSLDATEIVGITKLLQDLQLSVYVDWLVDPKLDRRHVTPHTAQALRTRMKACRSLLFAFSENSPQSKWMPWELGYFDGNGGRIAVLPVVNRPFATDTFAGQEYLSLYPYVTQGPDTRDIFRLWIHNDRTTYVSMTEWLAGRLPRHH
jgi:hypothetical protein